jgi:hypothetical protein
LSPWRNSEREVIDGFDGGQFVQRDRAGTGTSLDVLGCFTLLIGVHVDRELGGSMSWLHDVHVSPEKMGPMMSSIWATCRLLVNGDLRADLGTG